MQSQRWSTHNCQFVQQPTTSRYFWLTHNFYFDWGVPTIYFRFWKELETTFFFAFSLIFHQTIYFPEQPNLRFIDISNNISFSFLSKFRWIIFLKTQSDAECATFLLEIRDHTEHTAELALWYVVRANIVETRVIFRINCVRRVYVMY